MKNNRKELENGVLFQSIMLKIQHPTKETPFGGFSIIHTPTMFSLNIPCCLFIHSLRGWRSKGKEKGSWSAKQDRRIRSHLALSPRTTRLRSNPFSFRPRRLVHTAYFDGMLGVVCLPSDFSFKESYAPHCLYVAKKNHVGIGITHKVSFHPFFTLTQRITLQCADIPFNVD